MGDIPLATNSLYNITLQVLYVEEMFPLLFSSVNWCHVSPKIGVLLLVSDWNFQDLITKSI